MDPRSILRSHGRRRLVNLRIWPLFQLRLPIIMLSISTAFSLLFMAHTNAAYGRLLRAGFDEPWLRGLAEEIRYDYLIVSSSIGAAYAFCILFTCLAAAHRFLGPIVALERHLERLHRGDYEARLRLRSGHPLKNIADDLNTLTEALDDTQESSSSALASSEHDEAERVKSEPKTPALAPVENAASSVTAAPSDPTPWVGWYQTEPSEA